MPARNEDHTHPKFIIWLAKILLKSPNEGIQIINYQSDYQR